MILFEKVRVSVSFCKITFIIGKHWKGQSEVCNTQRSLHNKLRSPKLSYCFLRKKMLTSVQILTSLCVRSFTTNYWLRRTNLRTPSRHKPDSLFVIEIQNHVNAEK